MTHPIVEKMMQERMAKFGKFILHMPAVDGLPAHDWTGYPKDREQLDKWIESANRRGIPWTLA